jgi:hypothetical protein
MHQPEVPYVWVWLITRLEERYGAGIEVRLSNRLDPRVPHSYGDHSSWSVLSAKCLQVVQSRAGEEVVLLSEPLPLVYDESHVLEVVAKWMDLLTA